MVAFFAAACSIPDKLQTPFEPGLYEQILERQRAGDAVDQDMVTELPDLAADDYERLGDQLYARRELGRALLKYERGIELEPEREQLRYKVGAVLLEQNLPHEAMVQFDRLAASNPTNPLAELGRGRAWFVLGNFEKSEIALRSCLSLAPDLWTAREALGVLLDRTGRHEDAIVAYRQVLQQRPAEVSVLNNLGVSLYLTGDYARSVTALEQAVQLAPKDKRAHKNLARGYAAQGRYFDALDAYSEAEGAADAYNYLGGLFETRGDIARAEVCFERAIEESPRFYQEANDNLVRVRRRTARPGRTTVRLASAARVGCP